MARPKIFNTAQGAQFTADAFTACLLPASHHRPHGQPLRRHRLPGCDGRFGAGVDPAADRLPDIPEELCARHCFDWAEGIVPLQESGHSGQFK